MGKKKSDHIGATTEKGGRRRRRGAKIGPLQKKEKEEEKVGVPFKSPGGTPLTGSSDTTLQCTPEAVSLKDAEIGGTQGSQSTLEKENPRSRAYNLEPLVGLHRYCV